MSLSKYVSEVKTVNQNHETVYRFLSDFNNLGKLFNETLLQQISQQAPQIKIESFETDTDSCRFQIASYGEAGLEIIDREFNKTIKIAGSGRMPVDLTLWIQVLPVSPYQCKMRLTLHAGLNMMMKMVAGKKLKEGVDKLADLLAAFPYQMM